MKVRDTPDVMSFKNRSIATFASSGRSGGPPSPAEKHKAEFDHWLSRRLRDLYDDVLEEPLPNELSELLNGYDGKNEDENDDADAPPKAPKRKS